MEPPIRSDIKPLIAGDWEVQEGLGRDWVGTQMPRCLQLFPYSMGVFQYLNEKHDACEGWFSAMLL